MSTSSLPPTGNTSSRTHETLQERLRRQTGQASRQQAGVDTEIGKRLERPPAAGDLFVLPETADHLVEWALLDRDPADPRRLLAVAADTNSLTGSADVAVATGARGCLSLRCAHAVWLDAEALDPKLRTGFLEPEILDLAVRKRDHLARGSHTGSVLEREVDDEGEYRDWVEVLDQARAAVADRIRAAPPEAGPPETGPSADQAPDSESPDSESGGKVVPFRRPATWGPMSRLLAVAASVLLLITLGLSRQLARSASQHRTVAAEQREELTRLEQERQRLTDSHRQDLAKLDAEHRRERQRLAAELDQRIAELEAAAEAKPRVNLPLLILASSQLRAQDNTVEMAPGADSLMLILQVDNPNAHERYRLEVRDAASQRQVWQDSSLRPSRLSELTALLPRSLMPDGRYELRLHGLTGGTAKPLMERILTLKTSRATADGTD